MTLNQGNNHHYPIHKSQSLQPETDMRSAEVLAEILARRAHALAELPPAKVEGQTLYLLTFLLNGERYSLEISYVREIYPLQRLTPVPRAPNFVIGLFSARGRLISVVDLHAFLGLPKLTITDESKIIVVAGDNMEIGLLADEVTDVFSIFKDKIEPPLATHTEDRAEYIHGITADMLVVLNLKRLLNEGRLIIREEGF
jgi:purine-binding chemotaxis protein CheW